MRQTLQMGLAAGGPCPFGSVFAATVVIHHGPNIADIEYICTGINNVGGPSGVGWTGHGEIEALRNCSNIIKARFGADQITNLTLWHQFSLHHWRILSDVHVRYPFRGSEGSHLGNIY